MSTARTSVLHRLAALIRYGEPGYSWEPGASENSVLCDDAEDVLFELRDAARAEIAASTKAEDR